MLKIGWSMRMALVMLAVGFGTLRAQDTPNNQEPPKKEQKKKDKMAFWKNLFNSFDTNKDGIVTYEEYKNSRMCKGKDEAIVKASFSKMDRKGDGKVTWDEFVDTWVKHVDAKKKGGSDSSKGGSGNSKPSNQ
jgi:hypothetical protein